MKKFIVITIAVILSFVSSKISFAQDATKLLTPNEWHSSVLKGDELRETAEQEIITFFTKKKDSFVHYTSRPYMLVISLESGIFDFERVGKYSSTYTTDLIIGYYDENDTLIDKEETILIKLGDRYSTGMIGSEKLLNYMRTQNGYVRFIADKFRDSDFDEKIPTWKTNTPVSTDLSI